jgi:hypothetical protein
LPNLTNFRIFNTNYADIDLLANTDESSEDASFPASNLFNFERRSKVWRSGGYWNITTDNNFLIFEETSTVDLTAVLNTGTYSGSTLATEVQRAMNAAGASTYTVTYTNGKFRIQSDGAGGGGILNVEVSGSTISDEIGLLANKTGALDYTMDRISAHGSEGEWILFDMGVSTNPDAFVMIDRKQDYIKISPTATIKLQGNPTRNFVDETPQYESTLTYDDETISIISDEGLDASDAYRFWRLYIYDVTNPNYYIQLGAVFLGNYMQPSGRAQFPLKQGYTDRSKTVFAESGTSFSDILYKTQNFSVNMLGYTKEDIEELDIFFNNVGTHSPFFVSMDTAEVWSSNKNRRIIYCKFADEPSYELIAVNLFRVNFKFREEL